MSDIDNKRLAKFEGACQRCGNRSDCICEINYSTSPDDRERLWLYLMGKEEMWASFRRWVVDAYCRRLDSDTVPFIPWLFSPLNGVPRWVSLLSEWLGMESVMEKFGWVECPTCWKPGDYTGSLPMFCPKCNSSGKVLAPWAR